MKYWMHTYWMYVLCTQLIYLLIVIVLWLFYYSTGTRQFIRSNAKFLNDCTEQVPTTCNKDTGGCKTLHSWSRGVFFVVSAGGHIEYWQPLYRLVCMATLRWLHRFAEQFCFPFNKRSPKRCWLENWLFLQTLLLENKVQIFKINLQKDFHVKTI